MGPQPGRTACVVRTGTVTIRVADASIAASVRGMGGQVTDSDVSVATAATGPLADDELAALDAWWRAANYLSVGQIHLMGNPLLREPATEGGNPLREPEA